MEAEPEEEEEDEDEAEDNLKEKMSIVHFVSRQTTVSRRAGPKRKWIATKNVCANQESCVLPFTTRNIVQDP